METKKDTIRLEKPIIIIVINSDIESIDEDCYQKKTLSVDNTNRACKSFRTIKKNEDEGLSKFLQEMEPKHDPNFEMVPYRWVVLVLFCTYIIAASQNQTFIAPVAKSMTRAYNITNFEVNLSVTAFAIANLVNFFCSMYFVEKIGIKWSITIS